MSYKYNAVLSWTIKTPSNHMASEKKFYNYLFP